MFKLATFPRLVALTLTALLGCDGSLAGAGTESLPAGITSSDPGAIDERCQGHEGCTEVCGPNQACGAACWRYVVDASSNTRRCEKVTCNLPGLLCEQQPVEPPTRSKPTVETLEPRPSALEPSSR